MSFGKLRSISLACGELKVFVASVGFPSMALLDAFAVGSASL